MLPHLNGLGMDMAKRDEDAVLSELRKVMEGKGNRRSRLDMWMTKNHAEFSALLEGQRPNWAEITRVFESMGLAEEGKNLGPQTARQTWAKVCKRLGDKPQRTRKPKAESVGLAPGIIREVVDTDKPRVSPISPVSPAVPVSSVRPTSAARDEGGDPDEVMRKLDEQLSAGRPRMPKPIR